MNKPDYTSELMKSQHSGVFATASYSQIHADLAGVLLPHKVPGFSSEQVVHEACVPDPGADLEAIHSHRHPGMHGYHRPGGFAGQDRELLNADLN